MRVGRRTSSIRVSWDRSRVGASFKAFFGLEPKIFSEALAFLWVDLDLKGNLLTLG
jgi:hypothetical protein